MKRFFTTTLTFFLLLTPILALAAPGIPHQFYGSVNYSNGSAISSGTVKAKIDGLTIASEPISNGKYGYNPNLFFVTDSDNNKNGKTISFFVNDTDTGETAVFVNGEYTKLDLIIPSAVSPAPTSGGTSGGGSYSPASTAPASQLSAAAKKVDTNKDNRIDILDFNTLMVNWGKTEAGNVADFDGSGKVDIFDFNLLMIHWTA